MKQYLKLAKDIMKNGVQKEDRTGTGTKSVFGRQIRFDLKKGFPLMTTKKIHWKSVVIELLWLMRGDTNLNFLHKHNVRIWDEWADENGDLGPVYGEQWRKWPFSQTLEPDGQYVLERMEQKGTFDQLKWVIDRIKKDPDNRRLIVSAWNAPEIRRMKLPPCHSLFQFYVSEGKLSCHLYQRSADTFLGVPFNIASYALLTHLIANECGLDVGEFVHTFGDVHVYNDHFDQINLQLSRKPMKLAKMEILLTPGILMNWIDKEVHEDSWEEIKGVIKLKDYKSHDKIEGKVSV